MSRSAFWPGPARWQLQWAQLAASLGRGVGNTDAWLHRVCQLCL